MNWELIEQRCRAGGLSIHEAAHRAWVDPVFLWDGPGDLADDRLPVGVLRVLSRILDVEWRELIEGGGDAGDVVQDDDVAVEAALAEFNAGLSRDDLAQAFAWSLERVDAALVALERRLRPSGRRVRPVGWHRYALGPNLAVLSDSVRARLARTAISPTLGTDQAEALYQIIRGWRRPSMFGRGLDRPALNALRRLGLVEQRRADLELTEDVVFSLRLDEH